MPTTQKADIKAEELRFEVLNERHNLDSFDCSFEDEMGLNEFIHNEALQFQKENLGVTYLFFYKDAIVGFATIVMSQLEIKLTKISLPFKTSIRDYPALMIGRLASSNDYRHRHVGENMCLWCLSKAKQLSKELGCRLIIVMTRDKKTTFYTNCGFDMIPKCEKREKKWMYLPVP